MTAFAGWPVRHPAYAVLILVLLAIFGIVTSAHLSLERIAQTPGTVLQVQAELPGIEAAEIESLVVKPLEEELVTLPGVHEIVSRSRDGRAAIELRFSSTAARESAFDAANDGLRRVANHLPLGMALPTLERRDPPPRPAAIYVVSADRLSPEVIEWTERELVRRLRESPEVAMVRIEGEEEREVLIQPDARRLASLGLSFDDLAQALRGTDQAPRRRTTRRNVPTHATVEVIAARAVRLPDGEPIALGEVAQVTLATHAPASRPYYRGKPALKLFVYPRASTPASVTAERAHIHLAWLRANGLLQPGIEVHTLFDEKNATRLRLRETLRLAAACFAVLLLTTYLLFGRRAGIVTLLSLAVWLPLSAGLLRVAGLAFNDMTATGLLLGCVALVMVATRSLSISVLAAVVAATATLPIAAGAAFHPYGHVALAFSLAALAAGVVGWLMTPWRASVDTAATPLARITPRGWSETHRALIASAMLLSILVVVALTARALPTAVSADMAGAELALRLRGENEDRLMGLGEAWLPHVRALSGAEQVVFSGTPLARWRLQLDAQRLEQVDLNLADIGRAFAVAGEGLIAGEIVDADNRLPLRLQLAAGVAGTAFERLLLRGEYKDQPAVYLRDVGTAEYSAAPRERLRVQQQATVEIRAHWRVAPSTSELARVRSAITLPADYTLDWELRDATPDTADEL